MTRIPPHDLNIETAVIGATLMRPEVWDQVADIEPADFYRPANQHIWQAICDIATTGQPDPVLVANRLAARGLTGDDYTLQTLIGHTLDTPSASRAATYAHTLQQLAQRRRLILHLSNAVDLAYDSEDPDTVITAAEQALRHTVTHHADLQPNPTWQEHMAAHPNHYRWIFPDFLERGDRLLITAAEGAGKSILVTQLAVQAAAGIHPWTGHPVDKHRATIIDLENSGRLLARRFGMMRKALEKTHQTIPDGYLRIATRNEGIDLTKKRDQIWLRNRCIADATEILAIGPVYRMMAGTAARGDTGGEDQARTITAALDQLRTDLDITLIIETHAPHAHQYGRDLRPFGSSVWLRWPEFGIGLRKESETRYELEHWRGARDQRTWPTILQRGVGTWPWTGIMPGKGHTP